ncbi:MAG: glycosyltransferase [Chitinophagaceae bacterium]|nr:MAG: glycosyltransferase [Chitinophagaceae bacterium]
MERIPQEPPLIKPLSESIHRPLWSVMIPVYNCSDYLKETIVSVLQQDMGESRMQIEVIDDASTDADIKRIVEDVGNGRVQYYRQPANVGSLRNFETCINRAQGHLIHLLHGDDTVKNGYYKKITELFEKFPNAGAAFCKNGYIDENGRTESVGESLLQEDGILPNWLYTIAESQRLQYVAITVKRKVYEALGSFYAVTYGEDWEMWTRIAKYYPTAYTPEHLANYRLHFNSISGGSYKRGKNIKDLSKVVKINNQYIPSADQKKMLNLSRKRIAYGAIYSITYIWRKTKSRKIVLWQLIEILKLYRDVHLIKRACRYFFNSVRQKEVLG